MARFANFYDGVSALLDKIADALDPDRANVKSSNYSTSVIDSLQRIADNFDPSAWGGVPEVFVYSSYITKEAKSGTSYRYTKAELTQLLTDNPFVVWKTTVSYNSMDYYGLAFIWKPSGSTNASVAVISPQVPVVYYGFITLSGTQTGYVSAPSLSAPSSGGGAVSFLLVQNEIGWTGLYDAVDEVLSLGGTVDFRNNDGTTYSCLYYSISNDGSDSIITLQFGPYSVVLNASDYGDDSCTSTGWPSGGAATGDDLGGGWDEP